jgi:hypothetical protein
MGQRLKHADLMRMTDETLVSELLDQMEGRPNWIKAEAIVKTLRKRMKERHLEIERRVAERIAEEAAKGGTCGH